MMMKKSVSAIAAAAMLAVGLGMPTAAFAEELSKGATTEQTVPDDAQVNDPATLADNAPDAGDEGTAPDAEPGTGDEGATLETPGGSEGEAGNGETTDTPEDQVTKGTVSVFGYDGKEVVATYTVEDGEVVYGDAYFQGEVVDADEVDGYLDSAEGLTLIGFEDAATGARFGDEDTFFGLLKKQSATTLYGLYGESFDTPLEDTVSVVTDLAGVYIDTDKDDKSRFEGENGFSATKNYLTDANTALRISTGAKVRFYGMQKALANGWAFAGGLANTGDQTGDAPTDTPAEEGIAAEGEANGWGWQVLTPATVTEDLKGRKVIRVPLKLTNNTGKTGTATNALGVTAWQDGAQLDPASIHSEEAEDDWNAMYGDTQPGATVNTACYFYLDSDSPVEVRIDEDLATLTGKLAKVTYNADGSYAGKAKATPAKDDTATDTTTADYVIPNGATINGESGSIDGVAYTLSKGDLRFNYQFLYDTPMSGDLTVDTPNADANKADSDKLANTGSSIIAIAVAAIVVVAAAIALVVVKMVRGKKAASEVVDTAAAEEATATEKAPTAEDAPAEEAPKTEEAPTAEEAPKSDDAKTE